MNLFEFATRPTMTPKNIETPFPRIYTFDLLRIFFVFAIVMLHAWEHFVGEDLPTISTVISNYGIYQQIVGTVFNYAALFALSLSFFLWGLKGFKFRRVKLLIFILGLIGLQLRNPEIPADVSSWSWEVYGFLLIAVLICRFWPRRLVPAVGLFLISISMLSVSLNVWMPIADQTVEPWRTMLFANRETSSITGWFLIPWIFVPTLAYTSGMILNLHRSIYLNLVKYAYPIALVLGLVSTGLYYIKPEPVPAFLGNHFYQFLFMQSPFHFWNHYLAFAAVVTLCLRWETSPFVQNSPLRYLSYLQWNRNFFLCYFFHFSIIVFLLRWRDEIVAQPHALDWLWLGIFILTEIMMQFFIGALKIYAVLWHWFLKKVKITEAV
jgi:hypothetical protein